MREQIRGYDFSTRDMREKTATDLFSASKNWRTPFENEWDRYDSYYNLIHDATQEMKEYCEEKGIPWTPAVLPDPYIQVESQICPTVPEPEFRGRDGDEDSEKAKQREFAVRYVLDNNRITDMNTANERRLVKLGDAYWKAFWDITMRCGKNEGDIRLKDIPIQDIFPDPACGANDIQSGQYLTYVYTVHKVEFARMYEREMKKHNLTLDMLTGLEYMTPELFDKYTQLHSYDDCVQIMEFWYKQPVDFYDPETKTQIPAGAVACTIQAGGHELKNVPMYWPNTYRQNQLFPFVHYWRIRDETAFYNKSELFSIMDLVDAGDRKFGNALLNDAMMSNDIIVAEEGAFADGYEPNNEPAAIWMMKNNKANAVKRLGGLNSSNGSNVLTNYITEQIQRATRNYDSNMGRETTRQTTATGLAMLREDSNTQGEIKKQDRLLGFERLFELIDWLCLEYFDDNRLLFIGAKDEYDQPKSLTYNSTEFTQTMPPVADSITGEIVRKEWTYYPKVDVTVNAGDGMIKGKQATAQALEKLAAANVTAQNYKLLSAELDILDLPQKKEISDFWESMFAPAVPKEITDALAQNPQLLNMVEQLIQAESMTGGEENAVPQMQNRNAAQEQIGEQGNIYLPE